ncbi:hypothetical protein [Pseudotenacibaculum haliotis]|uniref:Uncharacterized protein n=1 Tax=Pseudotenacibaculum haliotis TaxID=1862138 RepID=A0ABW5LTZ9_9FLAO
MSTYLYTSFIPKDKKQFPELFGRLYGWVKKKGIDIEMVEFLDSANFTQYPIENIDAIKTLNSDRKNSISFNYMKLTPYEVYGTLELIGDKRGLGYNAKENGSIFFSISERSIWGWFVRNYLEREEYEKIEEHKVAVLLGFCELFNEWVELCEDLLQHASLYTEGKLRSRITSTMGYYTSYKDFIFDYSRILIDSHSENYFPDYLNQENSYLHSLDDTIVDEAFYSEFKDENYGSLNQLIKKLDSGLINSLNTLDENKIKRILNNVLKDNHDVIFNETESGFILSTYPLSSLWLVYHNFLEKMYSIL